MDDITRAYLEKKQEAYSKSGQEMADTVAFQADHNHPFAAEFKQYRQVFDSLPYASGPRSRFYSFKDESNYSELVAPFLAVSYETAPLMGLDFKLNKDNVLAYLRAAERAGWPEEIKPVIQRGKWRIATTNIEMADKLIFVYADNDHHVQNSTIYIRFDDLTAETFAQVRAIVDSFHQEYLLASHVPLVPDSVIVAGLAGITHYFDQSQRPNCWI